MTRHDFQLKQSEPSALSPTVTKSSRKDRYFNSNRSYHHPHHPHKLFLLLLIIKMSFSSALSSQLLKGKRVLVTGGGRGIGRAIALICHQEGANVVVTSRTKSELEETVRLAAATLTTDSAAEEKEEEKRLRLQKSAMAAALLARRGGKSVGRSASLSKKATSVGDRRTGSASKARMGRSSVAQLVDAVKTGSSAVGNDDGGGGSNTAGSTGQGMVYYVCDVTDEKEVDSMVGEIVTTEGDIDILINNAGRSAPKGPVGTLPSPDFESILKLNVMSPQLVTAAVCEQSWTSTENSNSQKVILNISSKAGKVGLENFSFYVASKFALEGLTSSWSKELFSRNVRVHSISPGMVDTKSFPKPAGKKGVRTASSIRDCLLFCLTGNVVFGDSDIGDDDDETNNNENNGKAKRIVEDMMDYTGHYIHVDEYDQVIREKGVGEAYLAWKPIDEGLFRL